LTSAGTNSTSSLDSGRTFPEHFAGQRMGTPEGTGWHRRLPIARLAHGARQNVRSAHLELPVRPVPFRTWKHGA
jgi:hypothetical protein